SSGRVGRASSCKFSCNCVNGDSALIAFAFLNALTLRLVSFLVWESNMSLCGVV
ncbi:hypothetical protein A2U01_0096823, partial [Trifolium medium]|nr:hypothetical protein [Trifolium medium]